MNIHIKVLIAILIAGALGAVSVLAHQRGAETAVLHEAEHRLATRSCPTGTRYSVAKPDGSLTCVFDDKSRYGMADRRQYVAAK